MISDEQLVTIGLLQSPGIGPVTFDALTTFLESNAFSLIDFWELPDQELLSWDFLKINKPAFLHHRKHFHLAKLHQELTRRNISVVTKSDAAYPKLLREIPDPPGVLFVLGELKTEFVMPIGIVGTRQMSSYGRMATRMITKELVNNGCEIVSGFMYGVDALAHQTVLEHGGYTVGVLGYGFDHCFPKSHWRLRHELLEKGGALMSEYLPWVAPVRGLFPARNRIVAGMCRGIVVTEAAADSGSKITAAKAADYGRDIFAVPGSITSVYSDGTKDLVNEGAKLITSAEDIFQEYSLMRTNTHIADANTIVSRAENEVEAQILEVLVHRSATSDELIQEIRCSVVELLAAVSNLEVKGLVTLDRGRYSVF